MAAEQSLLHVAQQFLDEARGAWRFRWHGMVVAWLIALLGWIAVSMLPNLYQATAEIYVDPSSRLRPLLQGLAVESNVDAEIAFVRQSLLSKPHLEKLVAVTQGGQPVPTTKLPGLVDKLRSRIELGLLRAPDQVTGRMYTIAYSDPKREVALEVVDNLVNSFIEDTRGSNQAGTEDAQQFLRGQLQTLEKKLNEADSRLADFKKRHVGLMPGEGGDYFSHLQAERDGVDKVRGQLNMLMSQREELMRQLRGQAPTSATSGTASGDEPGVPGFGADKELQNRIKETEARLDDLLLRFTDRHPEVIALRETLDRLKQKRAEQVAVLVGSMKTGVAAPTDNPVYQNMQMQLSRVDVDIASMKRDIEDRSSRIGELQKRIDTAPDVEAELVRLNRDYGVTKAQYEAILERLQRARLTEQADQTGVVKLQLINPPTAKIEPVSPRRPLFVVAVFLLGLAGGAAFALVLHQLNPVFASPTSLASVTGVPVLGSVGKIWLARHLSATRHALWRYCTAVAALTAVFMLALIYRNLSAEFCRSLLGSG